MDGDWSRRSSGSAHEAMTVTLRPHCRVRCHQVPRFTAAEISQLRSFPFELSGAAADSSARSECAICLCEFESGQQLTARWPEITRDDPSLPELTREYTPSKVRTAVKLRRDGKWDAPHPGHVVSPPCTFIS